MVAFTFVNGIAASDLQNNFHSQTSRALAYLVSPHIINERAQAKPNYLKLGYVYRDGMQ